ncbi:MAG: 16S rRNA (adenine(1518)-N(6)/adenine(1519)-N(6))-dimethyltransferase RsmA, partial [Candidatus Omnitrophota bacterium]
KSLYAVETDPRLFSFLKGLLPGDHIHLIQSDFLNFTMSELPAPVKVVGNLPYCISTPIIEKLISERLFVKEAFLTVQHEFGKRLTARPHSKDYGSLSCYVQYYAQVNILFLITPSCFRPIPKVTSCFLRLSFRDTRIPVKDETLLFNFIRAAFQHRRKTLANALSGMCGKPALLNLLEQLNIKPSSRPETLALTDYCNIINKILE